MPTACDQERRRRPCRCVAPWRRTSAATKPGKSEALQLLGLGLGDRRAACAAWSARPSPWARRRAPAPARRPRPARRRSRAARRRTRRAGSPATRTTTQRVLENSDGADSSPSSARVSPAAAVSESSASASWRRTASRTAATVRSLRNSSLPVTRVTRPRTSSARGRALVRSSTRQPVTRAPTPLSRLASPRPASRHGPRPRRRRRGRCAAPRCRPPPARRATSARGVAVVVVGAHRDHREPRAERRAASPGPGGGCRGGAPSARRPAGPGSARASAACPGGSTSPVSSIRTPRHLGQQHDAGVVGRAAVARPGRRASRAAARAPGG